MSFALCTTLYHASFNTYNTQNTSHQHVGRGSYQAKRRWGRTVTLYSVFGDYGCGTHTSINVTFRRSELER